MFQYEGETKKIIEAAAKKFYDTNLDFHNFGHEENTAREGTSIVERCEKRGLTPNRLVIELAILFHDAGYIKDHVALGFKTKEEYSAALAEQELRKVLVPEDIIEEVKAAIIATELNTKAVTLEQKIVRAADLSSLAVSYETFVSNTIKLKHETEYRTHSTITWEQWKKATQKHLGALLLDSSYLGEIFTEEEIKEYLTKAQSNLSQLLAEDEAMLEKRYQEMFGSEK